jgi:hypothetical protein
MHPTKHNRLLPVLFALVFLVMFLLEARPAPGRSLHASSPSDKGEVHDR